MKETPIRYRHEYKYLIDEQILVLLRERIRHLISPDPHTGPEGHYSIRSLYFDDYYHTCYYDNENGTDPREKYRIRIYNANDQRINLECKRKENGMTHKTSSPLTRAQADQLIGSTPLPSGSVDNPVLRKFLLEMVKRKMTPSTIVEYQRTAYIYEVGNVRVTFDTNIVASQDFDHFFQESVFCRPVLPLGYHLMEVKFDQFLPDFIYQNLQLNCLQQTTFSKYYLCRKINII